MCNRVKRKNIFFFFHFSIWTTACLDRNLRRTEECGAESNENTISQHNDDEKIGNDKNCKMRFLLFFCSKTHILLED